MKTTVKQTQKEINGTSYSLRRKTPENKPKQNNSKSKLKVTKTKKSANNLIEGSPTVLSTKIRRQKTKQLADVSNSKTKQLDTPKQNDSKSKLKITKAKKSANNLMKGSPIVLSTKIRRQKTKQLTHVSNSKTKLLDTPKQNVSKSKLTTTKKSANNSLIKGSPTVLSTKIRRQKTKQIIQKTPITRKAKRTKDVSVTNKRESKPAMDIVTPQTSKIPVQNVSVLLEQLTVKTNEPTNKTKEVNIVNKIESKTPMKIVSVRLERLSTRIENLLKNKTQLINSTPQNKCAKPTRVLRKRNNAILNKYKDYSLDSPFIKKSQKPATPNPLAVYEFEYDPSEPPSKKQNRRKKQDSESSGEEDIEMRAILKKLRNTKKKGTVTSKKKQANRKQKIAEVPEQMNEKKKQTKIVQMNNEIPEISITGVEMDPIFDQIKASDPVTKKQMNGVPEKQVPSNNNNNDLSEISDNSFEMVSDQSDPLDHFPPNDPSIQARNGVPVFDQIKSTDPVTKKQMNVVPEIQLPSNNKNNELSEISDNSFEMVSISDQSDPLEHFPIDDPSIQARNIVDEVTKSFIEDLSDEDTSSFKSGKIKIISNVVVRKSQKQNGKKIFNSTVNDLKRARPWRIDVSAIRKRPYVFTYKDKSFTPRYDPEIISINGTDQLNPKPIIDKNPEKPTKPTYQTSILDFVNGSKPKVIENKVNVLFNEPVPVQSPRKVLGEINFIQSTPLKPLNNLNILKSPNISFISPKKKSFDGMFGFSYNSEDGENKENVCKSPIKLSPKKNKPITVHKEAKEENMPVKEAETNIPMDNDISVNLFQDIENRLEVSKKSTRKYVRKHPKRKRLPSGGTIPSDDEDEEEPEHKVLPEKKRRKNVRTLEEEKEADRLAAHYNSMFEEIEKDHLIVE